ncbi:MULTISPECIES: GPW/gp25 family protein [unclassified Pseudomonas]|uniref:GPW/gp25 family protein n=1 Tax=unclassified Pseudomonas TaxID=196821 RepID=UPI000C88732C|nr:MULTISPECIES: GPW/gp25 family protein [unclassified Pseudomonas]PNA93637.1 baseplate assembly protein [Pseudomonas sp. GW460-5]PNB56163.1 baseplate assembly protein [Pseudomonas sp. FW305-130]
MNRHTGEPISEEAHIAQSIVDILTTRIGTRVMRRDYGSLVPELIDHPLNAANRLRLYAASAVAIMQWEPRITLAVVRLDVDSLSGSATLEIEAKQNDTNAPLNIRTPIQLGAAQ